MLKEKIVDGKLYSTKNATSLGFWTNGLPVDNEYFLHEILYKTEKGNYFILGRGGSRTLYRYKCYTDVLPGGGWDINPATEEQAKQWAERHLSVEKYQEIFGKVEES